MFRFTRKPSSGSHSQYFAKITHTVQCGYMEVVQTSTVLWLHSRTCEVCERIRSHASQVDDGFLVNRNMLEQPP
jgi:hypothetical protein